MVGCMEGRNEGWKKDRREEGKKGGMNEDRMERRIVERNGGRVKERKEKRKTCKGGGKNKGAHYFITV